MTPLSLMQDASIYDVQEPVAGVDESGRGPLAGPVVAAAVILRPGTTISGLDDSKKLTASCRTALARDIRRDALAWSVAWSDAAEIDALNILQATMLAMRRAIIGLPVLPRVVEVDGDRLPDLTFARGTLNGRAIVGGDGKVAAISAASIIAKTTRDQIMVTLDGLYPAYGFARHKGYGTEVHRDSLLEHGPCVHHRRSFAPVRTAL